MKIHRTAAVLASILIASGTAVNIFSTGVNSSSVRTVSAASVTYTNDLSGFITRMYNVCADREPSEKALANWKTLTSVNLASGAVIVQTFFNSDEYKARKRTNEEIVEDCYKAILGRSADASGKATWVKRLEIGMTVDSICKGLVSSTEFKNYCTLIGIKAGDIQYKYARDENFERTYFVYRLYDNCLGRKPDIAGLENWCLNIKKGYTGAKMVNGFVNSTEYKNRKTSNNDFVTMLYKTLLGRNPDENGLKTWTAALRSGKSRNAIINGFLFSSEFKGQCAKVGIVVGTKLPE